MALGGQVVVLDHDQIEQSDPMVSSAPAGDRVFFETPPTRGGLSRIKNLGTATLNRFDELRRGAGNSGKTLDEIQCYSFGAENPPGRAGKS